MKLSWTEFGLIIGIICGVIFGLALLITGFIKKKVKFGILGFVLSMIVSPVGLIGILPVFAMFLWLILRKPVEAEPVRTESADEDPTDASTNENPVDVSVKDSETSPENQVSGD